MFKKIRQMFGEKNVEETGELIPADFPLETPPQVETDERPVVRFGLITLVVGFGGFLL